MHAMHGSTAAKPVRGLPGSLTTPCTLHQPVLSNKTQNIRQTPPEAGVVWLPACSTGQHCRKGQVLRCPLLGSLACTIAPGLGQLRNEASLARRRHQAASGNFLWHGHTTAAASSVAVKLQSVEVHDVTKAP